MKSVDITLLIQGFNFFVAYWFLHRYVFTPAAQILEQEELHRDRLQTSIKTALIQREDVLKKMKSRMVEMKHALQHKVPDFNIARLTLCNNMSLKEKTDRVKLSNQELEMIKTRLIKVISEVRL